MKKSLILFLVLVSACAQRLVPAGADIKLLRSAEEFSSCENLGQVKIPVFHLGFAETDGDRIVRLRNLAVAKGANAIFAGQDAWTATAFKCQAGST